MPRPTAWLLITFLLVWHAFFVAGAWREAQKSDHGRDYATYHYAAQVALEGGDPYDKAALAREAQADGTRRSVFPFLYPPSFLLLVAPFSSFSLKSAYLLWFGLGEVALAGLAMALSRWWGRGDPTVTVVLVGAIAMTSLVPDNLLMGQANLPVMALAVAGIALAEGRDGRRTLVGELGGGALVGAAIALKLSPLLLVGWWLLRLRWRPAIAALAVVAVLLGISAAVFGPGHLLTFATAVVPTLSDGTYNGLGLSVGLFGNHSIPNLWHQALPSGGALLSSGARLASTATVLVLGAVLLSLAGPPRDDEAAHAQLAGVMVFGLLVPVFTYEHHTIWALPAVVLAVMGVIRGRLHPFWAVPLGLAVAFWASDLALLKRVARGADPVIAGVLQEGKSVALMVLLAAMVAVGTARWRRRG